MVVVDRFKCLVIEVARKLTLPLVVALITLISADGFAASSLGRANVTLIESINFEERRFVDYGTLVNENGTCSIDASGQLQGSNGSNCNGDGQVGEFLIQGTPNQSVSISVSSGESLSGITFTPELLSLSSTVLVEGQTVALVGGKLDLENATHGSHALTYTISVNYD